MRKHTWLSPRFNSDIICSALESATIFARGNSCKRVASTRGVRKNGYKYMHEIKSDMDADLFPSLGSRLK